MCLEQASPLTCKTSFWEKGRPVVARLAFWASCVGLRLREPNQRRRRHGSGHSLFWWMGFGEKDTCIQKRKRGRYVYNDRGCEAG